MTGDGIYFISVCCMKNDVENVVSDAVGMKDVWGRGYKGKLLNVENDWDGDVNFPEVMGGGPFVSSRKKRLQQLLKD